MEIRPVRSRREAKEFLQLPWSIYAGQSNWVPPLLDAQKKLLDTAKHPFWKHATLERWNAYVDGRCVGRIAAVVDENHNRFHEERTGFWGFFECIDDQAVAEALFAKAEAWVKERGMTVLRGPVNPSMNYECGLQISAFETTPYIMMTQNPAYYPRLVERAGFQKAKDLYAWNIHQTASFDQKLIDKAKATVKKEGIRFRHLDMKHFDEEIERLLVVYNESWEKNWGFVPLTPDEFRNLGQELKHLVIPQLIFIVEVHGEIAGFSIFLPDLNQIMIKIRDGKLFPTGLLKFLYYTKVKRTVNRGRIAILGVKKKFRELGLGSMMYFRYFVAGPKIGFAEGDCSWILEDNTAMNEGLRLMGATLYKTYRIYDKPVS